MTEQARETPEPLDLGPMCRGNTPDGPCDDEMCEGHGAQETPEPLTPERVERAEDWTPIERAYAEAMHEDCTDPPAGHPVDDHSPWSGGDLDGVPTWAEFTAQLERHGLTLALRAATPDPAKPCHHDAKWVDEYTSWVIRAYEHRRVTPDPAEPGLREAAATVVHHDLGHHPYLGCALTQHIHDLSAALARSEDDPS